MHNSEFVQEIETYKLLWDFEIFEIIPIVICALGTFTKGLVQGLEDLEITGRVETIQTTALLRSVRIVGRLLETWCHSNSIEKLSANTPVKNSKMSL